ncbi:MAG TPA: hypothetical protein VFB80_22415 [Pirellulaceae bacterium]|nr:hypothetical protein [Pirellulaceae bacterium]
MRRLILILAAFIGLSLVAAPAQAWWGCHWRHCGWGYRGCGWGGYCGYRGYGWGGYGNYCGFGPAYYYPAYNYPLINYGGYGYGCGYGYGGLNYGTPISIGYYANRGGYYNANSNFALAALPQPRTPILTNVDAQTLQAFLNLSSEVRPALALSERALPKLGPRVSNLETRQRAMRLISEGDTLFAAQNFNSALQKYKLAANVAPDVDEAYWRQGHAFVATKNFELAATAFKRAIANTDNLGRGGFRLDDLYGGASITKASHLESLAETALARNGDADAYFLIGLFLNYDGQAERASKFFARASELAGISGGHIAVFLDHEPAPVVRAAPAPATPPAPQPQLFINSGAEI